MIIQPHFRIPFTIPLSQGDFLKEMKLSALLECFQDGATRSIPMELAFGESEETAWVLSRLRLEIRRMPSLGETVYLDTWIRSLGAAGIFRDFRLHDEEGELLGEAASQWGIVDRKSKALLSGKDLSLTFPPAPEPGLSLQPPRKISGKEGLSALYTRTMAYSDGDGNGHVNNARYGDLIMDAFSLEELRGHALFQVELNYLRELFPRDRLTLHGDKSSLTEGEVLLEGSCGDVPVFRARLGFRPRNQSSK